ncbi:MAG: DUF192 domain-containing protein [Actinomycetota bacterium]|nr:DUF192 domain-containing protein [Actinomycetota bacterium]
MPARRYAAVLGLLLLAGCATDAAPKSATISILGPVAMLKVRVEIARTPAERQRGLMGRPSVPAGTGMLFAYPDAADWGGYWMKDTLVPLDIAFINNGTIFEIDEMIPCRAEPCPLTTPKSEYDHALEVAGGSFARAGIGVGARIDLSRT